MSGTSMITVRHINDYSHAQIVSTICGHETYYDTTVTVYALLAQAHPTMPCNCLVIITPTALSHDFRHALRYKKDWFGSFFCRVGLAGFFCLGQAGYRTAATGTSTIKVATLACYCLLSRGSELTETQVVVGMFVCFVPQEWSINCMIQAFWSMFHLILMSFA